MADELLRALLGLRDARTTDRPVSGEERGLASQFLQQVLNKPAPGEVLSGGRVDPAFEPSQDPKVTASPVHDFALMLSKRLYPEAWQNVDRRVQLFDKPDTAGVSAGPFMFFNPNDVTHKDMEGSMDTFRHELAHAVGLDDERANGMPSAYDVSDVSKILHRDVSLPKERKARK